VIQAMWASALIAAAAAIILFLGLIHLSFTFRGRRLHPRDAGLKTAMESTAPVLSRQTTMWRAWVGFNASHAMGAMLYGLVYLDLALLHGGFLFGTRLLLWLGLAFLLGWLALARLYWFSTPLRGIALAALLYAAGLVVWLA
jgi:hypothetical protein